MTSLDQGSIELRPETLAAIDAVRGALKLAQDGAGRLDIAAKEGRDVVTTADFAAEDLIRSSLTAGHRLPVIGEERGGEVPADGASYWLVDPICGTRNYASGTPLWCVNLALIEAGSVSIGVVGDASTGEFLVGERGHGVWALSSGSYLRLATAGENRTVVIEEGKSDGSIREHAAQIMAEVVRADRWDFRSLGTTLSLAYLAAGRISAYVVVFATSLHVAAGTLLVAEAGGIVTDIYGAPWTLKADSLLAAADRSTHKELLRIASQARPA